MTYREVENCTLCNNGDNKIVAIYGLNILSKYAIYDIGKLEDINYCPKCGRKLSRKGKK
jgi:hypothetical protein